MILSRIGYIYSIVSKTKGTVYIGSTVQEEVKTRWNQHKNNLRNNRHDNYKLHKLYYHHGVEEFIFTKEQTIEFNDYQELIDIEGIEIRHIPEDWSLNIERHPELGYIKQESFDRMRNSKKGIPKSEAIKIKIGKTNSGINHPMYGKYNTQRGKEVFLHSSRGKHYFVLNVTYFCEEFCLRTRGIFDLISGRIASCSGWTGERAPKWLVEKVKPLMKEGQLWVEIDENGNMIP